jgi:hypothetical protein
MESTGPPIATAVLGAAIAVVSIAIAVIISRFADDQRWPLRVAFACFIAPAAVTYVAIGHIIKVFQWAEQTRSGGLGAIAAGIWESQRGLLFALYASSTLVIVTFAVGLSKWEDNSAEAVRKPATRLAVTAVAALGLAPIVVLRYTTGWIIRVITPGVNIPLAGVPEKTATLLTLTAAVGIISALLLLLLLFLFPLLPRSVQTRRTATVIFVGTLAALVIAIIVVHLWSARLYHIAVSGSAA